MGTTRPRALAGALAVAAALAVAGPQQLIAPAHAAPPANDEVSGAIVLVDTPSTPSRTTFDSSEATSNDSDGRCVGGHSVWFRFRADDTQMMAATTAGSDFDTRFAIFYGRPGALNLLDCNGNGGPGKTSADTFRVREGSRYWIAVSSSRDAPGGSGVLTIGKFSTPTLDLTIDGATSGQVSGRLTVSGTATCTAGAEFRVRLRASQRAGDGVARARTWWGRPGACTGSPAGWKIRVDSETGWAFHPGDVWVSARGSVWDGISGASDRTSAIVTAVDEPNARLAR